MMKPAGKTKHRRSKSAIQLHHVIWQKSNNKCFPSYEGNGICMLPNLGGRKCHIFFLMNSFPEELGSDPVTPQLVKLGMETSTTKEMHSAENGLKQEILLLEKRLQSQFKVRGALEKALGYRYDDEGVVSETSMPATELVKDIAILEMEVLHLEQHLLLLYRKVFDQKLQPLSPAFKGEELEYQMKTPTPRREQVDSGVYRCHSALSQRSLFKASPDFLRRDLKTCYSQPLSMTEFSHNASSMVSLAEHLGARISDLVPETPNKIAEEMIKYMAAIFWKLSLPAEYKNGVSSPVSPFSSASGFSPQVRVDNPFLEGFQEFSGPYSMMIDVPCIYRSNQKLSEVENLLQSYRSLVSKLIDVNPRRLKHEEKLAFWINLHNALVMHAYVAYGIPNNNVKRFYLLLKAAYNVGGHNISADTIQSSILGCRMSRPRQWLRLLFPSKSKFKIGDDRQVYAINHPEPLLHFALTSGSYSDPAVRVYSAKRIIPELDTAKEEYIRANFGIRKDQKILLPKIVEAYAKESGLNQNSVTLIIHEVLPESVKKSFKKALQMRLRKKIEFTPHNFAFRYLISRELAS